MISTLQKIENLLYEDYRIIIGLDVDIAKFPASIKNEKYSIYKFNKEIIQSCSEYCAGFKFNLAFYEAYGNYGIEQLLRSIEEIPSDKIIIGDGKRSDIGNTSEKYAFAYFDYFKFDCSTLNPYMGFDSLEPFLKRTDKYHFILSLTSNASSIDFQKLKLYDETFLFQFVLKKISEWNSIYKNCGTVFGATHLEDLRANSIYLQEIVTLLPGVGAQGASAKETAELLFSNGIDKFFINASRSVIYKDTSSNFAEAARLETKKLREETIKG
jgi:orotidine-5'-phosphate decarboxylase